MVSVTLHFIKDMQNGTYTDRLSYHAPKHEKYKFCICVCWCCDACYCCW